MVTIEQPLSSPVLCVKMHALPLLAFYFSPENGRSAMFLHRCTETVTSR